MTEALAPIDERTTTPARAALRWAEFMIVFVGAPLPFVLGYVSMSWMMPTLLVFGLATLIYLLLDPGYDRRALWHWRGLWREAKRVGGLFLLGMALLAGLMAVLVGLRAAGLINLHENVRWFALPRRNAALWATIMLGYPIVSVYPQELIYRAFLFRRYRGILTTAVTRITASALVFGWVHVVFATADPTTWLPVGLCMLGGLLFGYSYERGKSLAAAWLEHALYGCFVFTIGLGWLFYGGSVREAAQAAGGP